jgi:hypothetical protein
MRLGRGEEPRPSEGLTALVSYRASEAVARALLELDLPGLSEAASLLRSVAQEQAIEQLHDDDTAGASYTPLGCERRRPRVGGGTSDDGYQPWSAAAGAGFGPTFAGLDTGAGGAMFADPRISEREDEPAPIGKRSGVPLLHVARQPTASSVATTDDANASVAAAAAEIDWAVVSENVRVTVHGVYEKLLATSEWLADAEAMEGVEGVGGGGAWRRACRKARKESAEEIAEESA